MFSSVSNKSIMLIKPSMIRALSAQAAPAAVSSSNKVRILCFGFSLSPFDHRAQPDWAYEFPDRTGLDTQIN